jgi:uncharacterized membrane-anchored protein
MDSNTKKAIKSGLFFGIFMSIINALIIYYNEGTFNILTTILHGLIACTIMGLILRFELKKQDKKESAN